MKRALVKVCHGKNDLIGYRTIGSVAGQILGGTQQILPSSSALDRRQLIVVSLLERKRVYIAQPPSSFISSSPAQTLPLSKPPLHTSPYSFPQSQPPTFSSPVQIIQIFVHETQPWIFGRSVYIAPSLGTGLSTSVSSRVWCLCCGESSASFRGDVHIFNAGWNADHTLPCHLLLYGPSLPKQPHIWFGPIPPYDCRIKQRASNHQLMCRRFANSHLEHIISRHHFLPVLIFSNPTKLRSSTVINQIICINTYSL